MMADENWDNLKALADQVPDTSVLYAPDEYAPMDPDTKGDWRFVMDGKKKIGFLWTDWQNSAGVIGFDDSDFFEGLRSFLHAAKNAGVPAGNAFSALGAQLEKTAPKGITVSETETGILSEVLESIFETTEKDDTESDNGDDS
jgi:hypothetical protein